MGYHIAGHVEFVVEVQWVVDDSADFEKFISGFSDPLAMNLSVEPGAVGSEALGAMVEGQTVNSTFVRYAGPAFSADIQLAHLRRWCQECFPRTR